LVYVIYALYAPDPLAQGRWRTWRALTGWRPPARPWAADPSALWAGDLIPFWSVILSAAGGIVGIWLGYRFGE